jgi:hypothetical protein
MAANSSDLNLIGIVDSALEVLRDPAIWILAVITFVIIGYVNHRTRRWSKRRWSVFELQDVLPEYRSDTPLKLIRNTFLSGAAVCLASLLGILQVGASDEALRIAVYGAAIGMPSWLCAAGCYEAMLTLGPKSYEWLLMPIGRNVGPIPALAGTFALLTHWLFARWWLKKQVPAGASNTTPKG